MKKNTKKLLVCGQAVPLLSNAALDGNTLLSVLTGHSGPISPVDFFQIWKGIVPDTLRDIWAYRSTTVDKRKRIVKSDVSLTLSRNCKLKIQ